MARFLKVEFSGLLCLFGLLLVVGLSVVVVVVVEVVEASAG